MKLKYYLFSTIVGIGFLFSCNDDFMQEDPQQEMAEGSFLKNEGDLPLYLNQFYKVYVNGYQDDWAQDKLAPFMRQGSRIITWDQMSDNTVVSGNEDSRLNDTYTVPQNGTDTGWEWNNLRAINYFLRNYKQAEVSVSDPSVLNKWVAEAYFFKAWDYYRKIVALGEVPWYVTDLQTNSPELYAPRTPRKELVDSVMLILDFAVEHIQDNPGQPTGRINRDMANFLKARFCLFEGTFRKYHTELNLQGTSNYFLEECVKACEAIMATNKYELYNTGKNPYWKLFTFKNDPISDGNKEAILARAYNGTTVGHCTQRYYEMNRARYSVGATKSLVDEYLCIDGRPIYVGGTEGSYIENEHFKGYDGLWTELENRDPRLTQTIAKPGEYITIYSRDNGLWDQEINGLRYPKIGYNDTADPFGTTVTGYWYIKHWMGDRTEAEAVRQGQQTAIEFRYAEVLLMLAEVKCELGTITQTDLDNTINELRKRAGFDFSKYPNSKLEIGKEPEDPRLDKIYAEKLNYPVSKLLREIRRERRIEMVMEGLRYEDLMRWKAGKLFTVPLRGMKFTEEKQKLYDGSNSKAPIIAAKAAIGTEVWVDDEGFLIAYPKSQRISNGTLPWNDRRYYFPIPLGELMMNPNLTQNSGWQDIAREE